ncbi:MAG: DMT family transporter [Actinomycetota bacterium]|nr:DMT family transporter [Actinomycetota bacterium]
MVLVAAVLHAAWNAMAKAMKDQVVAFGLIGVTAIVWGVVVLVVARGPARAAWPFLALSAAIHVVYNVTLLNSYRFGDLSQVYPLARGLAPLLVAGGAEVVAGETLGPWQIVGVAVIAGGLTSLVWVRGRHPPGDRRALTLAVATGVAIAAYSVVDGLGVRRAASPLGYAGALFVAQDVVVVVAIVVLRRRRLLGDVNRRWGLGVLGGLLSVSAYSLVLWAQTRAPLATVSALRETSVVVAALFGTVLLREGSGRRRILAALVVVAGIALIVGP